MEIFTKRLGLALSVLISCCAWAGTVTTKDGQGFTGLVQFADAEHLSVGPAKGPRKLIALADVLAATFDPPLNPDQLTPGAPMAGKGRGLLAAYHDRPNFKGRVIYRLDETIDHQWHSKQPVFDLPRDYFSVRWSGELEAPVTGEYTFTVLANDGGKLKVGTLEIGRMEALAGFRERGKVMLQGGKRVPFVFEFFDNYGEASARIHWQGPGFQAGPIPSQQLYPAVPVDRAPRGIVGQYGFLGSYYQNRFFYGDAVLAVDPKLNFTAVKPPKEFADKNYSVRWTGQLDATHTEEYTFKVETDEGVRLWVGGRLVVNQLSNRALQTFTGTAPLERGKRYNVRLESVHRTGGGRLKASWVSKSMQEAVLGGDATSSFFEPPIPEALEGGEVEESRMLGVFSWGGSRVAAAVATADDSAVYFVEGSNPAKISTVNVARIVLTPVPERFRARLAGKRKGILLRNGDFIEGELQELKADWLTINSVLFGIKVYGRGEVIALMLGKISDKPVRSAKYEVRLENGSLLFARRFILEKGSVVVDDPTVGKINIPLAELEELRAVKR